MVECPHEKEHENHFDISVRGAAADRMHGGKPENGRSDPDGDCGRDRDRYGQARRGRADAGAGRRMRRLDRSGRYSFA